VVVAEAEAVVLVRLPFDEGAAGLLLDVAVAVRLRNATVERPGAPGLAPAAAQAARCGRCRSMIAAKSMPGGSVP
jgi:hypothetical protein